jgi:hypothetical protein
LVSGFAAMRRNVVAPGKSCKLEKRWLARQRPGTGQKLAAGVSLKPGPHPRGQRPEQLGSRKRFIPVKRGVDAAWAIKEEWAMQPLIPGLRACVFDAYGTLNQRQLRLCSSL